MKCDDALQRFLEMDNRESFPISLRFHMLHCAKCRTEIETFRHACDLLLDDSPFEMRRDLSGLILDKVTGDYPSYRREMSYARWFLAGFIIIASRLAVSYSDTMVSLQGHYGGRLEIPLNIVLGLVVSIYAVLFIGTHVEELKRIARLYFKWL